MPEEDMEGVKDRLVDYTSALPPELNYVRQDQVMEYFNDDSVMDMERTNFLHILSNNTFHVPKYQRLYSWKPEQHEDLWESASNVLELRYTQDGTTGRMVATNSVADIFFGTFFIADKSNQDRMEVIDGQQRITTGLLFLSVIKEQLKSLDASGEALSARRETSVEQIKNLIYSSPDDQLEREGAITYENNANNRLFYALISGEDGQVELLESEEEHEDGRRTSAVKAGDIADDLDIKKKVESSELNKHIYHPESNRRMLSGYKYYEKKVEEELESLNAKEAIRLLINLKNYLLRSFTAGKVYIHRGSSPELRMGIFQAINDRGKPLSKTDKIRARIANLFSETEYEGQYTEKWESIVKDFGTDEREIEEFLKTYIAAYESEITKMADASDHMMEAFGLRERESYILEPRLIDHDKARDFLDRLEEHVNLFLDLQNPESRGSLASVSRTNEDEFLGIISRLKSLGTRQWRPLILRAYYETNEEDEEQLMDLIRVVEKIFFRLALSDLRANNLEETFPTVANALDDKEIDQMSDRLIAQAQDDASPLFGDTFGEIIVSSTDVSDSDAKIILYKLASKELDQVSEGSAVKQEMKDEGVDLEHVLPKKMVREDEDDQFVWFNNFFNELEFDTRRLEELKRHTENDDLYDVIKRYFIKDIANVILLEEGLNRSLKNKPFATKIEKYYEDSLFEEITVNNFFTDDNHSFNQGKLDNIDENEEFWNAFWNVESFKSRRKSMIRRILDLLEIEEDEFESVLDELDQEVDSELERRIERIRLESQ